MDTQYQGPRPGGEAQQLALVARSRHDVLLRLNAHRLSREDLEDCYSQAVLELLASIEAGRGYASPLHMARVLEQRFVSRIQDRRRALAGRSPMQAALHGARPLAADGAPHGIDPPDPRLEPELLTIVRDELRRALRSSSGLTRDQRLAIGTHLAAPGEQDEIRRALGWSAEKHRKVSQRARARLRRLMEEPDGPPVPTRARMSEEEPEVNL